MTQAEIKRIASELSNSAPRTQMEIVRLCKKLVLGLYDYITPQDAILKYHKAQITLTNNVSLDFHFFHASSTPLTKNEFIEYIKKIKNINLDFNGKEWFSSTETTYFYVSINWPIVTEDILELKSIGCENGARYNLFDDNIELSLNEWNFNDEVIYD